MVLNALVDSFLLQSETVWDWKRVLMQIIFKIADSE